MTDKDALSTRQLAVNVQESLARPAPVVDLRTLRPLDNPQRLLYSEEVLALLEAEC
jgi:hypothetical protein